MIFYEILKEKKFIFKKLLTMKEWKSKKELDDFIFEQNRYEEIGYCSLKTLKKWGISVEKEWEVEDYFYIVQKGNSVSFYVRRYS